MFWFYSLPDNYSNDTERNEFITFLMEKHRIHLFNHINARIYLKSADEINYCLNGVFIAAANNYNKLKRFDDCLPWLLKVAKNITITENRKYLTRVKYHIYMDTSEIQREFKDIIVDISSNPEETVINDMINEKYEKEDRAGEILRSLMPEEFELWRLKFQEKLSDAEIAGKLGMPL